MPPRLSWGNATGLFLERLAIIGGKGRRAACATTCADHAPTGKLMETIIESVDEFYSENLAQEMVYGITGGATP